MENHGQEPTEAAGTAEERLAEIEGLYAHIRTRLRHMIDNMETPKAETPKSVLAKLDELHSAHLKSLAAEEKIMTLRAEAQDHDTIDFDALRAELGREIDRIRASL